MSPHLHTDTDTYTQLKIELVFKNSPAIVLVLILLKLSVLLGDTDPGWSVCNWISFLNISSSLLGLANHLFSLTVPAGATYYEFLFFSFSHLFLLWPNSLKKKSGISDISMPKWTLSFSALDALFSLHDLVTWLLFTFCLWGTWPKVQGGTSWWLKTVAVLLQEGLQFLYEVLWAALVWGPIDTSFSLFLESHVRVL